MKLIVLTLIVLSVFITVMFIGVNALMCEPPCV
jgi:hypothetical protein